METERCLSVERQGTIDLEEMIVSPNLNRAITGIYDADLLGFASGVDLNRTLRKVDRSNALRLTYLERLFRDD